MKYRRLGNAGMQVSAVSLGGWINFGAGKMGNDTAEAIVKTAYDAGVNFYDLADVYARGEAETQMGRVLAAYPRDTLVISSKVFHPMSDDVNDRGLSRKHIMQSIDASLTRLGTDYLDIYFCHRYDPATPLLETVRAMDDLIHQGKILYWGTSEWSGAELQAAHDLCEQHGYYPPQSEQPQYSMLYRERVEGEILPVTEPRGIGLVIWSPMAQGMLTGKYDDGIPADSRFSQEVWLRDRYLTDDNAARVRKLAPIAADLGVTRGQLALAWVLRQTGVSSVITGATNAEQVSQNVPAADVELTPDVIEAIDAVLNG